MKKLKLTTVLIWAMGIIFIATQLLYYSSYRHLRAMPPSETWSKPVKLSSGNIVASPSGVKTKDGYVIAHDDGSKVVLLNVDKLGNVKDKKELETGSSLVEAVHLFSSENNFYILWRITRDGELYLEGYKLDASLKEVEKLQYSGITASTQADENYLFLTYKDRIEGINYGNGKRFSIAAKDTSYFHAVPSPKGYVGVFVNADEKYAHFMVVNDVPSKVTTTDIGGFKDKTRYLCYTVNSDGDNCTILYQMRGNNNTDSKALYLSFSLKDGKPKTGQLKLGPLYDISAITAVPNKNGSMDFMANTERLFSRNSEQRDVVKFTVADGEIKSADYISCSTAGAFAPSPVADTTLYMGFDQLNQYDLLMSSTDSEFKAANNHITAQDKKTAFYETLDYMGKSIASLFILGISWILTGLVLFSIFSFVCFSISPIKKKVSFIVLYTLVNLVKFYYILTSVYKNGTPYMAGPLSSIWVGILVLLVITTISTVWSYQKYLDDMDNMPLLLFLGGITMDSILALSIFYPLV